MTEMFLNNFCDKQDIEDSFELPPGTLKNCKILLADYTYACYSGDAYVLFAENGKLYEVTAGHCSCYGLAGMWDPEETSVQVIETILERDGYCDRADLIREAIKQYKKRNILKKVVFYEATDGTHFDDEEECLVYEQTCNIRDRLIECRLDANSAAIAARFFVDTYDFTPRQ